MTLFWQILIDGFAISSLYALGATGFALIFGVSGVLNLSHGALMVAAVVAAWWAGDSLHAGPYAGAALGVAVGFAASLVTYFVIVRPLQSTRKIREQEKEIFILTATLLAPLTTSVVWNRVSPSSKKASSPWFSPCMGAGGALSLGSCRTPGSVGCAAAGPMAAPSTTIAIKLTDIDANEICMAPSRLFVCVDERGIGAARRGVHVARFAYVSGARQCWSLATAL